MFTCRNEKGILELTFMQNFKSAKKRPSGSAVDGFLSPRKTSDGIVRRPSSTSASGQIRRVRSYRPEVAPARARTTSLGDFRQPAAATLAGSAQPLRVSASSSSVAVEQPWGRSTGKEEPRAKSKKRRWPLGKKKSRGVKTPTSRKKKILKVFLILSILLVLTAGFLAAKTWWNARKVLSGGGSAPALQQDCADLSQLKQEGDCRVNVLVMGRGGDSHTAPDLTDTIIIASIDPVNNEAALVSIPRDFYVTPDGGYGYTKINAVYANAKNAVLAQGGDNVKKRAHEAGVKSLEKTVENTLGIPIHYYGMIDFKGFQKAIDTVGGVSINVKTPVYEEMVLNGKPYVLDVKKGQQEFNGLKALMYSRSRYTSARGDFDRAARQREIIVALKDKVLSAGTYGNPVKITQLLDNFGSHTQTNFSVNDLARLYAVGKEIDSKNIKSIGLADPPRDFLITGMYNGQSVVLPKAGLGVYGPIQNYIRSALKDPYVKKENASILVLNGTSTAGLATEKVALLKSLGYNVGKPEDAPTKNYQKTIIVDMRDGEKKYSKHYLEKRFKTTAVSRLPDSKIDPGMADFVIILGQNETVTQ